MLSPPFENVTAATGGKEKDMIYSFRAELPVL
jgi:hypothetical protein